MTMLADFAAVVGPLAGGLYLLASLLLVAYVHLISHEDSAT